MIGLPTTLKTKEASLDKNTISHTTWEYKYHLIFAPKHRRQIIY